MKTKIARQDGSGNLGALALKNFLVSVDDLKDGVLSAGATGAGIVGGTLAWQRFVAGPVAGLAERVSVEQAPKIEAGVQVVAGAIATVLSARLLKNPWARRAGVGAGAGLVGYGAVKLLKGFGVDLPALAGLGDSNDVLALEGAEVLVEAQALNGAAVEVEASPIGDLSSAFGGVGMGNY